MSTKQLYEKTSEGMKEVSPLVAIEDIYSKLSDTPLEALVSLYNHVKCEWKGSVADTRRTVPLFLRRSGLFITYNNGTKYITEFFSAETDQITTEGWVKDSNWTPVPDEDYISAGVKPGVGTIGYEQLSDNLKQLFREKVNVTNFPDDEDIASVDNMLKLKNREVDAANFQSKGYIILRKNLRLVNGVVKNILTQDMINQPNTIYEIRYDFNLNSETIELQEGCTLKFEGGSLNNGKIVFNKTFIDAKEISIFKDISISGMLKNTNIKFDWFSNKDITILNEILEIRYSSIPNIYINGTIIAEEPIKINRPINLYCDNFEFHQSIWGYPGVIINSSDVAIYGNISVYSDVEERTAITNTYFPNIVDKKASSSAICLGSLSEPKQIKNIHIEKCYLYNFIAGILSHGRYAGDWGTKNIEINYCYIENIDFGIFGASWYGLFINMIEFKNIASYINSKDPSHVVYITGGDNEIASENIIINNLVGTGCISKSGDSVLSLKSCVSFRCLNSTVNNIGYFAAVLNSKCELSNIYINNAYSILGAQLEGTLCKVSNIIARNVKKSVFACSTNATLKVSDCDIEYTGEIMPSNKGINYVSEGVAEFRDLKIKAPDNSTIPLVFYNTSDVNSKLTIYNPITNVDIVGLGNGAKIGNIIVYLNPYNVDMEKIVETESLLRLSIILLENNNKIRTAETAYIKDFLVSKIVKAQVSTINRIYAPKNQFLILKNGGNCTLVDSDDFKLKQANTYKANSWNTLVFISTEPNSIEELFCDYHPSGSFNDKPEPKIIGLQYFNTDTNKMITWDGSKWRNPDGTEATQ